MDMKTRIITRSEHMTSRSFLLYWLTSFVLLMLLCVSIGSANAQQLPDAPGWTLLPAPVVRQAAPDAERASRPSAQLAAPPGEAAITAVPMPTDPEVLELARALRNDPDLIFEYVYNNIETLPFHGSLKGILGTIIDGSGSAFDQAELMAALLRVAGFSPTLEAGKITLTAAQATTWLGTDASIYSIGRILGSGGIAYNWSGPNTNITDVSLDWGWVRVAIGGISYVFNPADKTYTRQAGLVANLPALMDYNQSSFLLGALSGSTLSPPPPATPTSITNINRPNVRNFLNSYADTLTSNLENQYPSAGPVDILGGLAISPRSLNDRQRLTAIPNLAGPVTTYPAGYCDADENLCASLTVTLPGASAVRFRSADIYGRRLSLFFNASLQPVLALNGQVRATGAVSSIGANIALQTSIRHPGRSADPDYPLNVQASSGGAFLLSNGWGSTSRGMIERHRRILQRNTAASPGNAAAEPVLGESLAVLGYTWLAQLTRQQDLVDAFGGTRTLLLHAVGLVGMAPSLPPANKTGPFVDLPLNLVVVVQSAGRDNASVFTAAETAAFYARILTASVLESGTIEQTQPGQVAVSTVKLLDMWAQSGTVYDVSSGASFDSIAPNLTGYSAATINALRSLAQASNRLILPSSGSIAVNSWAGTGYLQVTPDGLGIGAIISGGLNGGFSTTNQPPAAVVADTVASATASSISPVSTTPGASSGNSSGFLQTIADPLNQVTGDYVYSHDDLSVGVGAFPYGLGFQRSYDSGRSLGSPSTMGLGWTHNFDLTVQRASDGFEGTATTSPRNGATAIAVLYIIRDILNTDANSPKPLDRLMVATLSARFLMDRLTDNVLRVTQPGLTESFLQRPDGSYGAPIGSASVLTGGPNGPYTLYTKDGAVLIFNAATLTQPGAITRWSHPAGTQVDFGYSSNGYLTTVSNNLGRGLTIEYAPGTTLISTVSDGTGRSVRYGYDTSRRLTAFNDPAGAQTTFAYDGTSGRLTAIRYPSTPAPGLPYVRNTYDTLGRVKEQRDAGNRLTQAFFAGRRTELLEPSGNRHAWYYDPLGRNTAEVQDFGYDPNGTARLNLVTMREYDGQARLTRTTLPEGNATATTYDLYSNPLTVTQTPKPSSTLAPRVTSFTYVSPVPALASFRRIASTTDPRNNVTNFQYDGSGNLIQQQQSSVAKPGSPGPVTPITTYAYTGVGLLQRETDPEGRITTMEYDNGGNLTARTVDSGTGRLALRTTYAYDAVGNAVAVVPPRGNAPGATPANFIMNQIYDVRRSLIQRYQPSTGTSMVFRYDADGRPVGEDVFAYSQGTTPTLLQSRITYTPTGQRSVVTDPGGASITYAYDGADRLLSTTTSSGRQTVYAYDRLSRLTRITDGVAGTLDPSITRNLGSVIREQRTYTRNGLLLESRDGNNNRTISRYDGFDRLDRTTYADNLFEGFVYDPNGNLTGRTTRAGQQITQTYDALNRLATRVVPASPTALTYAYGYDLVGRPLRLRQSTDTADATYAYDTAGRMIQETSADGRTVTYGLDADGNRITLTWPETGASAYLASYAYDAAGRMTGVSEGSGTGAIPLATLVYDTASRRRTLGYGNGLQTSYAWRPSGRVETLRHGFAANASVTFTYVYNSENGLSGRLVSDTAFQPGSSNPALVPGTRAYVPNSLNQYTSVAGATLTYDANGNLTGNGTSGTYTYDAQNRLISATVGGITSTYAYDPQGRRRSKTVGTATTRYLSAGDQEIAEYTGTGTGTLARRFVYGPGIDEPVATVNGDGSGRVRAYHHADGLGSIVALTSAGGTVTERHVYTPFGVADSTAGSPYQFAGRRLDAETGLYYQRARYYAPMLGRFLQMDPIGTAGGLNLYAYVGNSPLNFTDPSGLYARELGSSAWSLFESGALIPGGQAGQQAYAELQQGNYGLAALQFGRGLAEAGLAVGTLGETQILGALGRSASQSLNLGVSASQFSIAPRVAGQLNDARLGSISGRITEGDLQSLVNSPNALRVRDVRPNNYGNINVIQRIDDVNLRITVPGDAMRIISVGPIRPNQVQNLINNGSFQVIP
jgi:RHS repeat-associated protein